MLFPGCDAPRKGPAVEHTAGPEECGLFVAGEVGMPSKPFCRSASEGMQSVILPSWNSGFEQTKQHPETYVSKCDFLVGAGGLREPRRKGAGSRLPAAASCLGRHAHPVAAQPQQLLPVSAAGSGRRCCTGAFFPAGLFGGSMLFSSTLVVHYKVQIKQKLQRHNNAGVLGGRGWITRAAHLKKPAGAFFPAGLFGGSMLFESTRSVRLTLLYNKTSAYLIR